MAKENKMGTMSVPKLVITMALPLMLSLLVQSLYNIVDGIFVGRISEEAFAATSLAYPVTVYPRGEKAGTCRLGRCLLLSLGNFFWGS